MIIVGVSEKDFPSNKALGAAKNTYAFKSDGKIYSNKANGDDYGPKFERLDVIGCGIIMSRKQLFFTYNGRYLGTAFSNLELNKDKFYASVCM